MELNKEISSMSIENILEGNYKSTEKRRIIAVVVPVYNAGKTLRKCIQSILNQSLTDFVLILVNDGSTDNSGAICDYYKKSDNRVYVIHKKNEGSSITRKKGVLSNEAQAAKYIVFCDADDIISSDALEKLYRTAETYKADMVCGKIQGLWCNLKLPSSYIAPSMNIKTLKLYNHNEIIEKLYISCFGITDFPISLYAKIYKTELISEAINRDAIVHFMGDDLFITLNILPNVKRLVIIPDTIYYYRKGGNTSKILPEALDDFLNLFEYKCRIAKKYVFPQDCEYLLDVELMNITLWWLISCNVGGYSNEEIYTEIKRCLNIDDIRHAAQRLLEKNGEQTHPVAVAILNQKYDYIYNQVLLEAKRCKWRRRIKKILLKIQNGYFYFTNIFYLK
ncbi:glycosyltransferase [Murimonas intestini]|nr:glycosyltransferase [Murimonas intestini]